MSVGVCVCVCVCGCVRLMWFNLIRLSSYSNVYPIGYNGLVNFPLWFHGICISSPTLYVRSVYSDINVLVLLCTPLQTLLFQSFMM